MVHIAAPVLGTPRSRPRDMATYYSEPEHSHKHLSKSW